MNRLRRRAARSLPGLFSRVVSGNLTLFRNGNDRVGLKYRRTMSAGFASSLLFSENLNVGIAPIAFAPLRVLVFLRVDLPARDGYRETQRNTHVIKREYCGKKRIELIERNF